MPTVAAYTILDGNVNDRQHIGEHVAADQRFGRLPHIAARDRRLSYRARGILAEWWGRPDGWTVTPRDLWRAGGPGVEGRDAIAVAFRELVVTSYALPDGNGRYRLNRCAAPG